MTADRDKFIAMLRASRATMQRTKAAHNEYIAARDAASLEFCRFANRYGWHAALAAQDEAEG